MLKGPLAELEQAISDLVDSADDVGCDGCIVIGLDEFNTLRAEANIAFREMDEPQI